MKQRIYLASSWRNADQPEMIRWLRRMGHEVYDFRHPDPTGDGFSWTEIDPNWLHWTPAEYIAGLRSPAAARGFSFDKTALDWCSVCVLLLPCGRSAHLEAGYAIGCRKPTFFVLSQEFEPELMYLLGQGIFVEREELWRAIDTLPPCIEDAV